MDFKQLEAFVCTVDCESFSGAATKLFLTQPTISAHIQSLESELRTTLILRTTKAFMVTEAGQRFYDYAASILEIRGKALKEFTSDLNPHLSVGASTVPATAIIPEIISGYRQLNYNTKLEVYCSDSMDILRRVIDRSIDVGLIGTRTDDHQCVFQKISSDELVIATPSTPKYLALNRAETGLKDLLNEPFIFRESQSGTQIETESHIKQLGIQPQDLNVVATINGPEVIKKTIMNQGGVSIISRTMITEEEEQGLLLSFPITDKPLKRNIYMVYKKDLYPSKALLQFIDFMTIR